MPSTKCCTLFYSNEMYLIPSTLQRKIEDTLLLLLCNVDLSPTIVYSPTVDIVKTYKHLPFLLAGSPQATHVENMRKML
jgi:hypothetical protein